MTEEHGKAITFLSLKVKGLFWRKVLNNMTVVLHAYFVQRLLLLCKGATVYE